MIQRIQTVYLLTGAILLALMFSLRGIWTGVTADQFVWFGIVGQIWCGLTLLLAVVSVFLYTNRPLQRRLVVFTQLSDVVLVFMIFFLFSQSGQIEAAFGAPRDIQALLALLLPVIAYILFFLARRGIERDIKLVKSMDRLR